MQRRPTLRVTSTVLALILSLTVLDVSHSVARTPELTDTVNAGRAGCC